jgi:hypothetical protein
MAQFTVSRNSTILRDAIGSLWITTAGSIAALGAVVMLSTSVLEAIVLFGIVVGVCAVLYPLDISTLRAACRLLRETSPEIVAARKKLIRRFGLVVGIEMLFFLIANLVLAQFNHYEYLVPIIMLIVGVHFFPVAALFKMWPYYLSGLLFSLAAIITLISAPYTMHIGRLSSWVVLPTVICALVAWLTAACVLAIQRKRLGQNKQVTL